MLRNYEMNTYLNLDKNVLKNNQIQNLIHAQIGKRK